MSEILDMMVNGDAGSSISGVENVALVLLLAFCIGHIIGWIYIWTHAGLSYSQMFASSLLVLPIIVSLVMLLMASSVMLAFGLFAVFAVVRFRNVLKDTRDTTFILWSIIEGMAVGTFHFSTALIGCFFISFVFLYMRFVSFGGRHRYDIVLSLQWTDGLENVGRLRTILRRHAVRAQLASQRDLDENNLDLSYRLQLRDPSRSRELLSELREAQGIARVALYHREDESEV
jgi:uncharacterized membrane protein YhiD involved in acid resistance